MQAFRFTTPLHTCTARVVLAAALASASLSAFAHHGWGDYDAAKPMTVKGKVAELNYANPHASLRIDIDGKRWTAILAPVSRMESRGASQQMLAPGKEVTLVGYPSRTTDGEMRIERVSADGKTVELR